MTIDWSKAPEGATHLTLPNSPNQRPVFWRVADGKALEAWPMETDFSAVRDHFRYGAEGCASFIEWLATSKPAPWTGEGLPPVDTVCEVIDEGGGYLRCNILAHTKRSGGAVAVYQAGDTIGAFTKSLFRPLRTAEQIAEEERRVAIAEMKQCFDSVSNDLMPTSNSYLEVLFGALHEAGYRKQVTP
ncbi:hypothetical protein [Pseudomonas syringae group sp. J254-4]|uniref:hypothetical protein n=1 Tax=Pseudomonas syringae group sp. J254-4 TaxID=3079589 RepID=UPI00290B2E4B|nr:hypothetical protein [Pseudomonas syringae group sp. J254-4]MDU8454854.1 hypothetical protein [Pseudomonas syringae group sp. J254-4]